MTEMMEFRYCWLRRMVDDPDVEPPPRLLDNVDVTGFRRAYAVAKRMAKRTLADIRFSLLATDMPSVDESNIVGEDCGSGLGKNDSSGSVGKLEKDHGGASDHDQVLQGDICNRSPRPKPAELRETPAGVLASEAGASIGPDSGSTAAIESVRVGPLGDQTASSVGCGSAIVPSSETPGRPPGSIVDVTAEVINLGKEQEIELLVPEMEQLQVTGSAVQCHSDSVVLMCSRPHRDGGGGELVEPGGFVQGHRIGVSGEGCSAPEVSERRLRLFVPELKPWPDWCWNKVGEVCGGCYR